MQTKSYLEKFNYGIYQFASQHNLLESNDKIIVSVSGGIDSVSLFCLLASFRRIMNLELHVVHFHHGLRDASDEEEAFVTELSSSEGIPCSVIRSDKFKGEKGLQNNARKWRYKHLQEILIRLKFNKIALGHHLDDLVETQLWKMMRGTSLFSLNPIKVSNPPYIRPLLNTPKKELKDYLERINQKWCEDQSNFSNDYTRNLIRNQIAPVMDKCAGGKLLEKFLALNDESIYLNQLFDDQIPTDIYETVELPYKTITECNPLFGKELIHRFLIFYNQQEITRNTVERIYKLVQSGQGNWTIDLKGNRIIMGKNKRIKILEPKDRK
ncbi:tRNA lysidine(34) synthetase TilS [bacterium]|nr:tRNA lysidine(34) synthetase TilS [bacterium]